MNEIKFSHNWNNKLGLEYFTTIRKSTLEKFNFYDKKIGEEFEVKLNGKVISKAKLINVDVKNYDELTYGLLVTDTGSENYKEIFSNFKCLGEVLILTFKRI